MSGVTESKAFFFEKKKQKTFAPCRRLLKRGATAESKVFCFLLSKKKALLSSLEQPA